MIGEGRGHSGKLPLLNGAGGGGRDAYRTTGGGVLNITVSIDNRVGLPRPHVM